MDISPHLPPYSFPEDPFSFRASRTHPWVASRLALIDPVATKIVEYIEVMPEGTNGHQVFRAIGKGNMSLRSFNRAINAMIDMGILSIRWTYEFVEQKKRSFDEYYYALTWYECERRVRDAAQRVLEAEAKRDEALAAGGSFSCPSRHISSLYEDAFDAGFECVCGSFLHQDQTWQPSFHVEPRLL